MKIAVVAPSPVPPVRGGAERLVEGLVGAINGDAAHEATLVALPSPEHNLPDLMASYRRFSDLDLSAYDLVISTKYPSWMVRHPCHVVYMLHTLRGLYDTYPPAWPVRPDLTEPTIRALVDAIDHPRGARPERALFNRWTLALKDLGPNHPAFAFPGPLARLLVHALDALALDPTRTVAHYAISRTVAERTDYFPPQARVRALVPPSGLEGFREGRSEGFFTASRLDGPKRLDLLIDAMAHVRAGIPLTIAGTGPEMDRLRQRAVGDRRITFLGFVPDDELIERYADARAVPFVPLDEDLGYITLEAMRCGTPVVTVADSGGPAELIVDGQTGLIAEPTPASLGAALQHLAFDESLARRIGEAGKQMAETITWSAVVQQLLEGAAQPLRPATHEPSAAPKAGHAHTRRPKIMALATYPAFPPVHGGAVRSSRLYGALATHADVEYVCFAHPSSASGESEPVPGFHQRVVPLGVDFSMTEATLHRRTGVPVTDIMASIGWQRLPGLIESIRAASVGADLAVLVEPYLLPALQAVAPQLPFVYDAYNAEYVMKAAVLPQSDLGRELVALVSEVERRAVRGAELVITCSDFDRALLGELGPTLAEWVDVANGTDVAAIAFTPVDERAPRASAWLDKYARLTGDRARRHLAVFVGSYHPPNVDAAQRVLEVAPDLPDVLFIHLGSHCQHFSTWRMPSNVVMRGVAPDAELRRLLGAASVAVNPMTQGGGSNLKLVEYLAAGVPVVSSTFGARGFDVTDGEHLLLADDGDLSGALRRSLADTQAAGQRARAARSLVEERYDWSVLGRQFVAALDAVTGALQNLRSGATVSS